MCTISRVQLNSYDDTRGDSRNVNITKLINVLSK